jgi:protein SCO1/2
VFTHCELVCPIMNGNVYRLTQSLRGQPVRFVGVSVDPINDTPERLRAYLASFEDVPEGVWTMLTGEVGQTESIVRRMGFVLEEDMDDANIITLPDGKTMRNIVHPVRFLVLDETGTIVGSYRGNNPEEVGLLEDDLKRVLAGRGMLN